MKKNLRSRIKILFFTALLFAAWVFFTGSVSATEPCRSNLRGHCVELAQTVIPGLEFLVLKENTLGELILSLYYFAFAIIGAATLVAMIYGGILYMTAGDNSSRAAEGRKWLGNAVTGLAVALVSWIILYTINPDLVTKLNLRLDPIKYTVTQPPPATRHSECVDGRCTAVDKAGSDNCTACLGQCTGKLNPRGSSAYCKLPDGSCQLLLTSICASKKGVGGLCPECK